MKRKLLALFLGLLVIGFFINLLAPFDLEFIEKTPAWILVLLAIPAVIYLISEFLNLLPISGDSDTENENEDS